MTAHFNPALRPKDTFEIDRARLGRLEQRFTLHHQRRFTETLVRLGPTARRALTQLPYVVHLNHSSLPAFVSGAPPGIAHFHLPGTGHITSLLRKAQLQAAVPRIDGLYLMGSGGSVAHTRHSDIDLWIVAHTREHDALQPKLKAITQWAAGEGLDLEAFLVAPDHFEADPDGTRLWLLDEFYRSAIWLCGKKPLWWLTPATAHATYAAILHRDRFIDPDRYIDFGAVEGFSRTALGQAALQQLQCLRSTPYKGLLKFELVRAYARKNPAPPLSERYKAMMHEGVQDYHALDTYLMLYNHLEAYWAVLPEGETRLPVIRALFAQKIIAGNTSLMGSLTPLDSTGTWELPDANLEAIRVPDNRRIAELERADTELRAWCADALALADTLVTDHGGQRAQLRALDHQLAPWIRGEGLRAMHAGIAPARHMGGLRITPAHNGMWRLQQTGEVTFTHRDLTSVLLWYVARGFNPERLPLHPAGVSAVAAAIAKARRQRGVLMANSFIHSTAGDERVTRQSDPLNYGGLKISLLERLDYITIDAYGGWHHICVRGREDCLEVLRQIAEAAQPLPRISTPCGNYHGLARRIESLLRDAMQALARNADFAFECAGQGVRWSADNP